MSPDLFRWAFKTSQTHAPTNLKRWVVQKQKTYSAGTIFSKTYIIHMQFQ